MSATFTDIAQRISEDYLEGLRQADYTGVISLFSSDGVVISPLYGVQTVSNFYRALFADTTASALTLKDILTNEDKRTISLFFTYHWTLSSGEVVVFDVVDYLQLNAKNQIVSLQIIYDTHVTRQAWTKIQI